MIFKLPHKKTVLCVFQVSHRQYVFLMLLQRSLKALQQTLQQDLEDMASKRERKDTTHHVAEHQPFTFCLGLLLKSAEVSLLLKPVTQSEGARSPAGSELSPSESRGTLEPANEAGEGSEKGNEGSGSDGGAAKLPCTVDQLLCSVGLENGAKQCPAPLVPSSNSAIHPDSNQKPSEEERTPSKTSVRSGSDVGGEGTNNGLAGGDEVVLDCKTKVSDGLSDPLSSKDLSDKDKTAAVKMPQSVSRYLCAFNVSPTKMISLPKAFIVLMQHQYASA